MEELVNCLESITSLNPICYVGDINLPEICYESMTSKKYSPSESTTSISPNRANAFVDTLVLKGYDQYQFEPTYIPTLAKFNKGGIRLHSNT